MKKDLISTSKFMSLILRHDPGRIGLRLDAHGWADLDELIKRANGQGHKLTADVIKEVVKTNEKKRFSISADGSKIRANQGHSIPIDLGLIVQTPPELLFHGTAERFLASIKAGGIRRGNRQHVHLSKEEETAKAVGLRHGKPVVLQVHAAAMHQVGRLFFLSDNGVWLTEHVPVSFIKFP